MASPQGLTFPVAVAGGQRLPGSGQRAHITHLPPGEARSRLGWEYLPFGRPNGPQTWMNEVARTPLVSSVPAPQEEPEGIWRNNALGSFLVAIGAESCGGHREGVSLA